ncbi:hypothetical protein FE782_12935 [Paenibacillus antri]|uniref:Fibronectin type-III domain-containing protein n=1 Tax=Paenibacillus antri TaxID=2582848 RepID=A0A5R9G611_9BACL|nr:polysaccharide lyase family 8 super-sandwich domain-containing protein [Paenibacillus antri]TLS51812.1 hypothetical protein FE782_12935 [Paenibacillus antri]
MMKRGLLSALIVVLLATFGNGAVAPRASANAPDDFDRLRIKWKELQTGGTSYDETEPHIADRIAGITAEAQAYWDTMEKGTDRAYLWSGARNVKSASAEKTSTYGWLKGMALAYVTKGSALEGNAALKDDIIDALDWLYDNAYNENFAQTGNWWDWQIGVPQQLLNIMVYMYDDLDAGRIADYANAVKKFTNAGKINQYTGANRVWISAIVGLTGAVTKNGPQLAAARDGLSEVFLYVTNGDGFYEDGSFIQHGTLAYNGGYGRALLLDVSRMVYWLEESPWEVTDPNQDHIVRWVYDSFEPLMYKGLMMDMTRGREISRYYSTDHVSGHGIISAVMYVSKFAPTADAAAFRSMAKGWIVQDTYRDYFEHASIPSIVWAMDIVDDPDVEPRTPPSLYKQYAGMDRAVQIRPNYTFGLSMSSDRIATHETINGENRRGWYTGEGMTYLYNSDISQYTDDFWPTVDPYRLPGTTVDTQRRADGSGNGYRDSQREAGGADMLGLYGTSAMKVKAQSSSMTAKKAWFAFDDEIVALGAGITSADGRTIETTIDNRKLAGAGNEPLTVNGAAQPTAIGWQAAMTDVRTMHLTGSIPGSDIGYYFPGGAALNGLRELRTGSWSEIDGRNTAPTDPIARPYMTLWFDHGIDPANETYEYVLLPGKTAAQVEAYASAPEITILENSPEAQAVRENGLNITGIQFWNDAPKTVGGVTSDKRAAVMTHETDDELAVSVSDPSQKNTGTIQIEIERSATAVNGLEPGVTVTQLSPTIRMTVHTAASEGKTFRASFRLAPVTSPPGTPDGLEAAAADAGEVMLSWNGVAQASGYLIKYGISSGNYTETVDAGPVTSYKMQGLTDGQLYYFTVSAYNSLGESANAGERTAVPMYSKVMDNADASGVTVIGDWVSSTKDSKYGPDYLHDDNAGRGTKSVTFTPELPAGTYKVSVWWVANANRSSTVPISVRHAGGTNTVAVDQRVDGGQWKDLGVHEFTGGSAEGVEISNAGANGYVVADAVKFERTIVTVPEIVSAEPGLESVALRWMPVDGATGYTVQYGTASGMYSNTADAGIATSFTIKGLTIGTPYYVTVRARLTSGESPNAAEVVATPTTVKIMDDADEGVAKIGEWFAGVPTAETYGAGFIHDKALGRGTKRVEFVPDLPAGTYKVSMWWTTHANRSAAVPVTIDHAGIQEPAIRVNERINGGKWNELGDFEFLGGPTEKVTISNAVTDGYVVVDALKFERILPPDETPPSTEAVVEGTEGTNGWYVSDATVTLQAADDRSGAERTYYSVDGGPEEQGNQVTIASEGTHTISYYSVDRAGNVEEKRELTVKLDKTKPSFGVTVTTATYGSQPLVGGLSFPDGDPIALDVQADDAASGVERRTIETCYGDGECTAYEGPLDWAGRLGEHAIRVTIADRAGHTSQAEFIVYVATDVESMRRLLDRLGVAGPLLAQLNNRLDQAARQLEQGHADQAAKHMHDFIQHLNNEALSGHVDPGAKSVLSSDAIALIEQWKK